MSAVGETGQDDGGFTLIEILVVMMLIGVVAAVTASITSQGMTATRDTQKRVALSQDLQRETERIARDLRVADTLRATSASSVVLDLYRGGRCVRRSYTVAGSQLTVGSVTFAAWPCPAYPTPGSAVPVSTETGVLLSSLSPAAPPFLTYTDAGSQPLITPVPALVRSVSVTLSTTKPGSAAPLTLSTTVGVRNAALF